MKILCLILSLVLCTYTHSSDHELLKKRLNNLNSMKASFLQTVKEGGRVIQKNRGVLYLKRPGKFRWLTSTPTKQIIISDGKKLWIYDEDLEQVTIKKLNQELKGTPALFLSGYDKQLSDDYVIKYKKFKNKDLFSLTPKVIEQSSYLLIEIVYQKDLLQSLLLKDKLGQATILNLYNIKLAPKIPSKFFTFTPPAGVDVVM